MADQYIQVPNDFQSPLHRGILCNHLRRASVTGAAEPFQSPLHRGILCNDAAAHGGHGHIHAFSPLFIGEYSATAEQTRPPQSESVFQSPLHRGILCNSPGSVSIRMKYSFQSPLHRGILCNYDPSSFVPQRWLAFQSPLHRGILCNYQTAPRLLLRPHLSVPSSSGNTLQPHRGCKKADRRVFQSPLHRGILCNLNDLFPFLSLVNTFSPLFIGEYSATTSGDPMVPGRRG